jgi:hypothetical protein
VEKVLYLETQSLKSGEFIVTSLFENRREEKKKEKAHLSTIINVSSSPSPSPPHQLGLGHSIEFATVNLVLLVGTYV